MRRRCRASVFLGQASCAPARERGGVASRRARHRTAAATAALTAAVDRPRPAHAVRYCRCYGCSHAAVKIESSSSPGNASVFGIISSSSNSITPAAAAAPSAWSAWRSPRVRTAPRSLRSLDRRLLSRREHFAQAPPLRQQLRADGDGGREGALAKLVRRALDGHLLRGCEGGTPPLLQLPRWGDEPKAARERRVR